jgi:hypothetical protein
MKSVSFPYKQGNLDWLCSAYAVINLLHLKGYLKSEADGWAEMSEIIALTDKTGNLSAAMTKGVHRGDVQYFLQRNRNKSSAEGKQNLKCLKISIPTHDEIKDHAEHGAIIYFKAAEESFTHFTVIRAEHGLENIDLYDSYGFTNIRCSNGAWFIDGKDIVIINLYALRD